MSQLIKMLVTIRPDEHPDLYRVMANIPNSQRRSKELKDIANDKLNKNIQPTAISTTQETAKSSKSKIQLSHKQTKANNKVNHANGYELGTIDIDLSAAGLQFL